MNILPELNEVIEMISQADSDMILHKFALTGATNFLSTQLIDTRKRFEGQYVFNDGMLKKLGMKDIGNYAYSENVPDVVLEDMKAYIQKFGNIRYSLFKEGSNTQSFVMTAVEFNTLEKVRIKGKYILSQLGLKREILERVKYNGELYSYGNGYPFNVTILCSTDTTVSYHRYVLFEHYSSNYNNNSHILISSWTNS